MLRNVSLVCALLGALAFPSGSVIGAIATGLIFDVIANN